MDIPYDVDAYEAVTVSSTAIGITKALRIDHNYAFITLETDEVRYRVDGTDPTASEGHKLSPGDTLTLEGGNAIRNFRAIRVTSDATIRISLGWRERGAP